MTSERRAAARHLQKDCWCGHGKADSDVSALSLDGSHFLVNGECKCTDHGTPEAHLHKMVVCKECDDPALVEP